MTSSQPAQSRSPAGVVGLIAWPALAMMIVANTGSIAQLSDSAEFGLGAVTVYLLPALLFLVPVALVSAELATGWEGGVFSWVREAFGDRWGFQANWLQWIQSVVLYPSLLSFAAASLAIAVGRPDLASNGIYVGLVVLVVFWIATAIVTRGIGATARAGSVGLIAGTIIPAVALILFMCAWLVDSKPSDTPLSPDDLIPPLSGLSSIALVVGTFIAFAGLEVNAVHIRQLKGRPRTYFFALPVAVIVILVMYMLGSIAISVVVPTASLDLDAGAAQAFDLYASGFDVPWLGNVLSGLLALGALAASIVWVAGPSRGLLLVGRAGYLPPRFQRTNSRDVQVPILVVQGCIVTVLALVFVVLPNTSSAFVVLQDMTAILYMCMYVLMFLAVLHLRRTQPSAPRAFRVPGIRLVAPIGILAALSAIVLGLVPPAQLSSTSVAAYAPIVIMGVLVLAIPSQLLYHWRRPHWQTSSTESEALEEEIEPVSERFPITEVLNSPSSDAASDNDPAPDRETPGGP